MKKLTVFVLLMVTMAFSYHEFFVSVTDAEYNEKNHTFQFTIKFIGHDLEDALIDAGTPELNLGTENELALANEYLFKYISNHFLISSNNEKLSLKFVGKEVGNDDFIYCYLESERAENFQTIEIENTLLTEFFSKQENIVHLKINDVVHSLSFNKDLNQRKINI